MIYIVVGSAIAVLSLAYCLRLYFELWRWARLMQGARVVIAHKGKVRLNAPLQEWFLWCNALEKDEATNGRVIYNLGATRVALIKKSFVATSPWREFAAWLLSKVVRKRREPVHGGGKRAVQGIWSAEDETVRNAD